MNVGKLNKLFERIEKLPQIAAVNCFTLLEYLCAHTDSSSAQLCGTIYGGMNVRVNKF